MHELRPAARPRDSLQLRSRHVLVPAPVLEEQRRGCRTPDVADGVDLVQHAGDRALQPGGGSRRERLHGGGAGRHEVERADPMLDAGEDRAELRSLAEAHEPDALGIDLGQRPEQVDAASEIDDRLDGQVPLAPEMGKRVGGSRASRVHERRVDGQADGAARREPRGRDRELRPVVARPVQVEHGRKRPLAGRGDEVGRDAAARSRIRHVAHLDRVVLVDAATVTEAERRARVVAKERRTSALLRSGASSAADDDHDEGERRELPEHR